MGDNQITVDHPDHYAEGREFEPIDVIYDWDLDFDLGNAVKYISRAGRKNPEKTIEDLEKATWYINHKIKMIKKLEKRKKRGKKNETVKK